MSAVLTPGALPLADSRPAPRRLAAPTPPALAAAAPLRSQLQPPAPTNRGTGIAVVVGLHIVLGWGLTTGLATRAVEAIKKPIELALLPEVQPPPPPPPKVVKIEPVQKVVPPPAYVPPPEVAPVVTPPPAPIQVVQATPPKEPVVVAAAPAPVVAPPAPPAAPPVVKREISLACPGYEAVLASVLEEAIDRVGIKGTVQTQFKIRGNQVVDVTLLSGPKEYHKYVQSALKRMRCTAGGADEVQVSLPVIFS
ncbi:energy transducer TonB [Pelomonas sp. P7]|uniref:Energy transducer TonB n=1 Tax=Pelomonas caseinilytica TaxID=2906763 RepID=A0ABS8XFM6_9BURK|nr:energy transducer TonB [Pelomonas sp. P7]MCE4539687.1 energy transducer TonB [Pelomonas sp. P7]